MAGTNLESVANFVAGHAKLVACLVVALIVIIVVLVAREKGWLGRKSKSAAPKEESKADEDIDDLLEQIDSA
ncbi:MAG: hypothetical protein P1U53_15525 [Sulfitobacter sp.]|nr:hypothetical protein [Sulfitobacter sp.]